jgi:hypothetical protein
MGPSTAHLWEVNMYTARKVLKLWGKSSEADQRRLKLKYFSGLSNRQFEDDFVSFLAKEFDLYGKENQPVKGQERPK